MIDAYTAITRSFNFSMSRFGYPRQSAAVVRKAVGWGDAHLLRSFVKEEDAKAVLEAYRRHHKGSLARYSKVFPGVVRLLSGLKRRGYKLAVASNRPTRFSWILIRHLGLKPYFNYVLCADKLRSGKPDPQILKMIMKRLSVPARDTVYVGDMIIDAIAGKRAGVKTVIVTTGSSSISQIRRERPWKIIKKIKDLPELLQSA